MKRTLPSGWVADDWDGDWTPQVTDPSGRRDLELLRPDDKRGRSLGLLLVGDYRCCRSDMGSDVSCTVSVPLDAVLALLEFEGYEVKTPEQKALASAEFEKALKQATEALGVLGTGKLSDKKWRDDV